ncbi:MAG: hypothetical protein IRZ00_00430 [Gemmatimonadetes bacterium]|nr:hypothetical protein [Gemmatimonadota bacterium]
MSEDRFEDFLRSAARELYHPPPATPRDAIWERIRAAQAHTAQGDDAATAPSLRVDSRPTRPPRGARWWTLRGLPLAAMLALGVALGRLTRLERPAGTRVAEAPAGGRAPAAGPAATGPAGGVEAGGAAPRSATTAGEVARSGSPAGRGRTASPAHAAPDGASAEPAERPGPAAPGEPAEDGRNLTLYRFAAVQTLNQAELLLTSFRSEARRQAEVDPQLAAWARDVLSSTRLLLDSPAASDPKIRGLLEDLELVLAQIVQLRAGGARAEDVELIEHALKQHDVLPRLRAVVPAGPVSAGT